MAAYLSKTGVSNTIVEKSNHPREHVGESLVSNTNRILDELGLLPVMEQAKFIRKYGAAWHPPSSEGTVSIRFAEFPLEGVGQDYTYHVDRGKFDLALLKHAEQLGTKVLEGVTVSEVLFNGEGFASGVRVNLGGQKVELASKIVVDASGRDTFWAAI